MAITILHLFRGFRLGLGAVRGPRGSISIFESDDPAYCRYTVHFDYQDSAGAVRRDSTGHDSFGFRDGDGAPTELPETERALGKIRFVALGNSALHGELVFEVFSRLPTPPPGATARTTVVAVQRQTTVTAGGRIKS